MSEPQLSRGEFTARMEGLEALFRQRFDQNDATCRRIEEKADKTNGRVTKLETDVTRIKTLWSAAVVVIGFFADFIRHKAGLS